MDRARLAPVTLPDFGMPTAMPFVPAATYAARLEGLRERAERRGYQHVVVYADRGSTIELRSGMALQADVIPATATDYFTTNIEDGLALADEAMRGAMAARYPMPGRASRLVGASCVKPSASTSIRTCCRSRTCRRCCHHSCSGRTTP